MQRILYKKIIISGFLSAAFFSAALSGCAAKDRQETPNATLPAPSVIEIEKSIPEEPEESAAAEDIGQDSEDTADKEQEYDPADYFYAEEISDEVFSRMKGKSFAEGCTTPREDLRYLKLLYNDIEGNTHEGEMVCNVLIADKLVDIFRQLYEAGYPIENMVLIDEYNADDEASMSDNNTSCFNYRVVSGTTKLSKHALGLAVDVNPRYNPYVHKIDGVEVIEPANGEEYADRSKDFDYKIDKEDLAYKLFTDAGFTWGGSWESKKDYQHFQM